MLKINELPRLQADVMQRWQRTKYRRDWKTKIAWAVKLDGGPPPEPLQSAQIIGIRYCCGVPPDRQNVWYSFKIIDGLLPVAKGGCGVIADDSPGVLDGGEDYYSVRVKTRKEQRITITVVECGG